MATARPMREILSDLDTAAQRLKEAEAAAIAAEMAKQAAAARLSTVQDEVELCVRQMRENAPVGTTWHARYGTIAEAPARPLMPHEEGEPRRPPRFLDSPAMRSAPAPFSPDNPPSAAGYKGPAPPMSSGYTPPKTTAAWGDPDQ